MNRRVFVAMIAGLAFVALAIFVAFSPSHSLYGPAYAQINQSVALGPAGSTSGVNAAPEFPSSETERSVDENTRPHQNIGSPVTATDPANDTLTYSLENAGKSHFIIVESTGQLQTGAPLDYETQDTYTVEVVATTSSGATDSITVTINVANVNEPGRVALYWSQPQVGTALDATLTDPDGDVSAVTWVWERSPNRSDWTVISGATSASRTPANGDVNKYLRATASYTDGEGGGKSARAVSGRPVRTAPSDNNAPEFDTDNIGTYNCPTDIQADICLYARRNAAVGARIYNPARATDPDRGDEVRYSLEGTDASSFGVVASTGELFTKALLRDANNEAQYRVTIKAVDPSDASDTVTVVIRPSGSGNNPTVVGPDEIRYPENGTWPVASYTASNIHHATTGWIVSVSPGGGDGDSFSIDDDGVLTFDEPPDYEAPKDEDRRNTYSFSIMSYDANPPIGQRPGQTFFPVTVIVEDVEEISGPSTVDYPENGAGPVATYTVSDPDGPSITWSLLDEDDSGRFSINRQGVLTFRASPDHETPADDDGDNVYLVTVKAVHGSKTNMLHVAVTVTNVNEAPEFPSTETGRRMVAEDAVAGEDIGDLVEAMDPDRDDRLTYTLGGDDATSFAIVASTGQLQTEAPLDSDTQSRHTVTVTATDRDGLTDEITVTITVADVNEAPEFDDGPTTTRTVPENIGRNQNIGAPVAATDDDGDRLTYTLGGTDAASFDIVASSGQLRTRAALDFEATSTYSVTVSVRDSKDKFGAGDTATDDEITVTIEVTDVEEDPEFPSTRTERMVAENRGQGHDIGAPVAATDGDNDALTYTLGGTDAASFDIDATTGQLQTKDPLDKETKPSYSVTVSVSDGNPDAATDDTINVTITVTNVQEAPVFPTSETGARSVAENTGMGQPIGDPVAATDGDNDRLTYTLDETAAASFDIDETTGQLRTKAPLDYEATSSYSVTVSVRDSKDADSNADTVVDDTIDVTITVTNVNEKPEFATGSATARTVDENTEANRDIGNPVAATDDDNNEVLTYTLGGADATAFDIDATSGQLLTKDSLDHEATSSYTVTISVRDSRDAAGDADTATDDTITVTINVDDVNETPVIAGQTSVDYAENGDGPVFTYTAADPEKVTLSWSLVETGDDYDKFTIPNGALSFNTPPNFEDPDPDNTYEVTVRVSDGPNEDTLAVTVNVTNVEEAGTLTRVDAAPG